MVSIVRHIKQKCRELGAAIEREGLFDIFNKSAALDAAIEREGACVFKAYAHPSTSQGASYPEAAGRRIINRRKKGTLQLRHTQQTHSHNGYNAKVQAERASPYQFSSARESTSYVGVCCKPRSLDRKPITSLEIFDSNMGYRISRLRQGYAIGRNESADS